eukprot:1002380-Amorphochlora_amoeboformis.AAC.1
MRRLFKRSQKLIDMGHATERSISGIICRIPGIPQDPGSNVGLAEIGVRDQIKVRAGSRVMYMLVLGLRFEVWVRSKGWG